MTIHLPQLGDQIITVKRIFNTNSGKEIDDIINAATQITGIHILAIAYLYRQVFGTTEEINSKINSLQSFYSNVIIVEL